MPHHPSLWFTDADVARVRALIAEGEPTASAIFAKAKALAERPADADAPDWQGVVTACAIYHLITGDVEVARKAHELFMRKTDPWTDGELGLASWALQGALLHECCYNGWTPAQQLAMTERLVLLARGQREIIPKCGNPHIVTNNHWAVAHAGSALAALAAHGHACDEYGGTWDLTEDIEWALGRTKVFLMHHGDQGMYHEGLGYQCYPASFWLPALIAAKNATGVDWVEQFPALRNMAASLYSAACSRPMVSDSGGKAEGFGMKLSWNDDGLGWNQSNTAILMIAIAHEHQRGALRWMFDRLNGIHANSIFNPGWGGWLFTLFFYPYDVPAVSPNGVLPNHITDSRQGLSIFRNHYQDKDDAILGCYARVTFIGGHTQDDPGSIRFMALNHDWIMGGGQARGQAQFQSIPTPADGNRPKPTPYGAVIWDEATATGGVFGMDIRKPSGCYAERYVAVDYSGASGAPVLLAVLDQFDDHLGRDWHWNMTFEPGLTFAAHEDGRGFILTAADGASLQARFLGATPDALTLQQTPESERTFQGGYTTHYPGRPYVRAEFAARENLGIYVVMTVQQGAAPAIAPLEGLAVQVGEHRWPCPFGAAVPEAFRPGESGTLCRHPSGLKDFVIQLPTRV